MDDDFLRAAFIHFWLAKRLLRISNGSYNSPFFSERACNDNLHGPKRHKYAARRHAGDSGICFDGAICSILAYYKTDNLNKEMGLLMDRLILKGLKGSKG